MNMTKLRQILMTSLRLTTLDLYRSVWEDFSFEKFLGVLEDYTEDQGARGEADAIPNNLIRLDLGHLPTYGNDSQKSTNALRRLQCVFLFEVCRLPCPGCGGYHDGAEFDSP